MNGPRLNLNLVKTGRYNRPLWTQDIQFQSNDRLLLWKFVLVWKTLHFSAWLLQHESKPLTQRTCHHRFKTVYFLMMDRLLWTWLKIFQISQKWTILNSSILQGLKDRPFSLSSTIVNSLLVKNRPESPVLLEVESDWSENLLS